MVDLQGRQAQCPSPILNESDQCGACAMSPSVVIDTDLINVQIELAAVEFVFRAIHDRAVDVADNFAAYFRHGNDAVRVLNECSQLPGGNKSADGRLKIDGRASLCSCCTLAV